MEAKHQEVIDKVNDLLKELHSQGIEVTPLPPDTEPAPALTHPFPSVNPCASETETPLKRLFLALAPPCQCCAGARIAVLLAILVLGVLYALL